MTSPFPASSSKPGEGHLIAHLLPHGISALTKITYQYPLKLISPSPSASQKSVLVFLLTYGGGLVGGDQVHLKVSLHLRFAISYETWNLNFIISSSSNTRFHLSFPAPPQSCHPLPLTTPQIDVLPSAKLSLVTQGHTKIFKSASPALPTTQSLTIHLSPSSSLCLLPDPLQPFASSIYAQTQRFTLSPTSSLCILDWLSAGRTARGESWALTSFSSRNELWSSTNRLLLRDNVLLSGDSPAPAIPLAAQMHALTLLGTLILAGPLLAPLSAFFLAEFAAQPRIGARDFRSAAAQRSDAETAPSAAEAWRSGRLRQESEDGVLWSAAKVRGCTVVKFGAATVEGGRRWVGSMILRQGDVVEVFGEEAVMCLR